MVRESKVIAVTCSSEMTYAELNRSIAAVKENAGQADKMARQTNRLAADGGDAVQKSVEAMELILRQFGADRRNHPRDRGNRQPDELAGFGEFDFTAKREGDSGGRQECVKMFLCSLD